MEFMMNSMFNKLDELELARHEAETNNLNEEEEVLEEKIKSLMLDLELLTDYFAE